MPIVFDLLHGEALVGRLRVPIEDAGGRGEIRVGDTVLRPVEFGERTQIVARAALTSQPVEGVIAGITHAAVTSGPVGGTDQSGDGDKDAPAAAVIGALALALAGADREGPAFSEAAYELGRAGGWRFGDILDAPATEVDRLASSLVQAADDGWHRIQFSAAPDDGAAEIEAICSEYATNLLRRLDGASVALPADSAVSPPLRAPEAGASPAPRTGTRDEPSPMHPASARASDVLARTSGREVTSTPEASPPPLHPLGPERPTPRPRWRFGRDAVASIAREASSTHGLADATTWPASLHSSNDGALLREQAAGNPTFGTAWPPRIEHDSSSAVARGPAITSRVITAAQELRAKTAVALPASSGAAVPIEFTSALDASMWAAWDPFATLRTSPASEAADVVRSHGGAELTADELADEMAWLLDAESDLRGVER